MYQSHYYQNTQNYSPHHDRTTIGSTTIIGGSIGGPSGSASAANISTNNINDRSTPQVPGAPPVNRLIDMLNKPTFGSSSASANQSLLTPNETRVKFEYYNSESRVNQDLPCRLFFWIF